MRRIALLTVIASLAATAASAAVLGEADVALTTTPTVFTLPGATFAFTFDAALAQQFDPAPYSVQTGGTGETSGFGGFLGIPLQPSLFDTSGVTIDGSLFPGFDAFPQLSPIPYSLVPGDLALEYGAGAAVHYGYARFNGDGTFDIAFESTPDTAIIGGAPITGPLGVPEPATWAVMLLGVGAIGGAMRRRRGLVPA